MLCHGDNPGKSDHLRLHPGSGRGHLSAGLVHVPVGPHAAEHLAHKAAGCFCQRRAPPTGDVPRLGKQLAWA